MSKGPLGLNTKKEIQAAVTVSASCLWIQCDQSPAPPAVTSGLAGLYPRIVSQNQLFIKSFLFSYFITTTEVANVYTNCRNSACRHLDKSFKWMTKYDHEKMFVSMHTLLDMLNNTYKEKVNVFFISNHSCRQSLGL